MNVVCCTRVPKPLTFCSGDTRPVLLFESSLPCFVADDFLDLLRPQLLARRFVSFLLDDAEVDALGIIYFFGLASLHAAVTLDGLAERCPVHVRPHLKLADEFVDAT